MAFRWGEQSAFGETRMRGRASIDARPLERGGEMVGMGAGRPKEPYAPVAAFWPAT